MNINIKYVLIFSLFFLFKAGMVFSSGSGTSSCEFLTQPGSARISALSEACAALKGGIALLNHNPAGIYGIDKMDVSMLYKKGMAENDNASLYAGKPMFSGVVGVSFLYSDTGKVELFNASGNKISKTGKRDMALSFGYAKKISQIPVGINLKFISSEIFGNKASSYAIEMGAHYALTSQLNAGVSLNNFGGGLKFIEKKEGLPQTIKTGIGYNVPVFKWETLLLTDFQYHLIDEYATYHIGTEICCQGESAVRIGYFMDSKESANNLFSAGFGIKFKDFRIDYSVKLLGPLEIPHELSFGFMF